jgi:hypothetical protein
MTSLEPLAHAIVSCRSTKISYPTFTLLSSVIRGRKEANTFHVNNYNHSEEDKAKSKRHQHSVGVLENVQSILRVKEVKPSQAPLTMEEPAVDNLFTNIYGLLGMVNSGSSNASTTSSSEECNGSTVYVLDDEDFLNDFHNDVVSAIFRFFRDATSLRIFVKRTWREFKHGRIALQTAALAMNAAIAQIEKLSKEFLVNNLTFEGDPDNYYTDHNLILDSIYKHCQNEKDGPILFQKSHGSDAKTVFAYDHGGVKLPASTMMCEYIATLTADFEKPKANQRHYSADEKRLFKCLSQLACTSMTGSDQLQPIKGDMIHKAAHMLLNRHQPDTWVVFAIQILWDTYEELGQAVHTGEEILSRFIGSTNEQCQRYLDTKTLNTWNDNVEKLIKWNEDWIPEKRQASFDHFERARARWSIQEIQDFSLLCYHPGLCGLLIADIQLKFHHSGMKIAGGRMRVLTVMHLYNAVRQRKLLPDNIKWADLEWFIDQQDSEHIFDGPAPKQSSEFSTRMEVVLGIEPDGDCREFQWIANRPDTSSEVSKNIISMADEIAYNYRGSNRALTRMSIANKLTVLRQAVEEDTFALSFDLMALEVRCAELLERIRTLCLENAPDDYPERFHSGELGPTTVVLHMLFLFHWPSRNKSMFPSAVKILRDVVENEGSLETRNAKEQQAKLSLPRSEADPDSELTFTAPDDMDLLCARLEALKSDLSS